MRQIYYRLVAEYNLPNKRSSYNQLSSQLVTAREKGEVDERRIEDRTRSLLGGYTFSALTSEGVNQYRSLAGWKDNSTFAEEAKDFFLSFWDTYELDMWQDQPQFVVVWIEKDALSRVVAEAANPCKVLTAPSRGYASFSYMRQAARRLPKGKPTIILHFADHDASGLDMTRDIQERFRKYGSGRTITVERIALTYEQVQEHNLIPNPTKNTDTRAKEYIAQYGNECWELDAIEPTELQRMVKEAIDNHTDLEQWKESEQQEAEDKQQLQETFEKWADVIEDVDE